MKNFKEAYNKAKTWADLDRVLDNTSESDLRKMRDAMKLVDCTTGLDMRQEFLLGCLNARLV